jgi:hypothetical protein
MFRDSAERDSVQQFRKRVRQRRAPRFSGNALPVSTVDILIQCAFSGKFRVPKRWSTASSRSPRSGAGLGMRYPVTGERIL